MRKQDDIVSAVPCSDLLLREYDIGSALDTQRRWPQQKPPIDVNGRYSMAAITPERRHAK